MVSDNKTNMSQNLEVLKEDPQEALFSSTYSSLDEKFSQNSRLLYLQNKSIDKKMLEKLAELSELDSKNAALAQRIDSLDTCAIEILTESLQIAQTVRNQSKDLIENQASSLEKKLVACRKNQLSNTIDLCSYLDRAADVDLKDLFDRATAIEVHQDGNKIESDGETTESNNGNSKELSSLDTKQDLRQRSKHPANKLQERNDDHQEPSNQKPEMKDVQMEFNPLRFHSPDQKLEFDIEFQVNSQADSENKPKKSKETQLRAALLYSKEKKPHVSKKLPLPYR